MRQKSIEVKGLSHHGAPIPTACRVGPILVTSRLMGKDPETGIMPTDPESQAVLCFENLKRVLAAGGMDLGDVVKLTVYLVSDSYRTAVNKTLARTLPRSGAPADPRFPGHAAARRQSHSDRSFGRRQGAGLVIRVVLASVGTTFALAPAWSDARDMLK